ncbi:hypothetical protein OEZ71_06695 [Defluviimonas sp. WL0050]|uniref:Uncharacterized protein n=1 Tax=Albidovulum litorale TaxID=2984134 RepID=A0ABT2ZLH4_9RHOB|nr:dimethylamine monooxygenase subunit DmmA family protein [Defluviimonas sp. WL0050]MCV2871980.1 hypothetical protein [Defluviimonas sp. WL0050]
MTKFNFPPSIASRPIWGTLEPRKGKAHLMIADAEGAEALIDLANAAPALLTMAHLIYLPKDTGKRYSDALAALKPASIYVGPSYDAAESRIQRVLSDAHMGLQIYLAGTEGLMGRAMSAALAAGLPLAAIQTEHRGSVARRMQCVHCKGITEDVTTDPFVCAHCGLNLFVRDHFSRRIGAYQGVCVDAEDPGEVPPQKELYS